MDNQEARGTLANLEADYRDLDPLVLTGDSIQLVNKRIEALGMAISALQAQDSKTRKNCDTCKHDPPSKKWPCVDCDMREPADRWEAQDVHGTNDGDMEWFYDGHKDQKTGHQRRCK